MRKTLLVVGLVLLAVLALLAWLPARWALPWLRGSLHGLQLQQVGGSVWQGHADRVLGRDGRELGRAQWRLSRLALFGHPQGRVDFDGPAFALHGEWSRDAAGQVVWRQTQLRIELADVAAAGPRLPYAPRGELWLWADRAVLQGGWPLELDGTLQWRQAGLQTKQGALALGELQAQLRAQGGVIHASWHDAGQGPLQTTGSVQFSPLGWRLDASLQARGDDPALQRWLATLGRADAHGIIHLQRRGGLLAASNKESTAP